MLVGSGMGSKTPAARRSRELWRIGTHREVEDGHVVEGLGWGTGWCCMPANGACEDGLVHVAHLATHCVGRCCCTLVTFTWACTCHGNVVVVNVAAMREAVVPVLELFCWQGGEATWDSLSSVAATISATVATPVATATANVATTQQSTRY